MTARSLGFLAVAAAAPVLLLTACGGSSSSASAAGDTSAASAAASSAAPAGGKPACVILPDADVVHPLGERRPPGPEEGHTAAGFEADIQNAQGDTGQVRDDRRPAAHQGLRRHDPRRPPGCRRRGGREGQGPGHPGHRLRPPDRRRRLLRVVRQRRVGELEGQIDRRRPRRLPARTRRRPSVVYIGGDPADGNAKMFHDGADKVMDAAGIKPAFETPGTWDGAKAGTAFEQAYTARRARSTRSGSPNDNNAGAVITILDKNGKKIPVSGQDASVAGLQNVLLGKQTATVYKPFTGRGQGRLGPGDRAAEGRDAGRRQEARGRHAVHRHGADPGRPGQGAERRSPPATRRWPTSAPPTSPRPAPSTA